MSGRVRVQVANKKQPLKYVQRVRRKKRIRGRMFGTAARPRVSMFRSNKHLMAQAIDDASGRTVACVSSYEKEMRGQPVNIDRAKALGSLFARRLKEKNIATVVYDRNGYRYHGVIKAFADSMRETITV